MAQARQAPGIQNVLPCKGDVNTPTTGNLDKRSPPSVVCAGGHCLQTAAHPLNPQGIKPGPQEAQGDNRTKDLSPRCKVFHLVCEVDFAGLDAACRAGETSGAWGRGPWAVWLLLPYP